MSETDKKPTGPAAAAREIDHQYVAWDRDDANKAHHAFGQERLDAIEAIIPKHCPGDAAVGKLVDALQEARIAFVNTLQIIDSALAKYESDVKPTECQEDKAEKLVEALRDCFEMLDSIVNRSYVPNKADLAGLFLISQTALAEYEEVNK